MNATYYSDIYGNKKTKYKYNNRSVSPCFGIVLGLNYKIINDLNISAEVIPLIDYTSGENIETNNGVDVKKTSKGYSFGLSNKGASIIIAYKF